MSAFKIYENHQFALVISCIIDMSIPLGLHYGAIITRVRAILFTSPLNCACPWQKALSYSFVCCWYSCFAFIEFCLSSVGLTICSDDMNSNELKAVKCV